MILEELSVSTSFRRMCTRANTNPRVFMPTNFSYQLLVIVMLVVYKV